MYLCACKWVSDQQIRQAVEQGCRTMADLSIRLGTGLECGKCLDGIHEVLNACLAAPSLATMDAAPQPAPVSEVSPPASVAMTPARAAWFMVDP